jgi:vitamin B12 transporter
MHTLASFYLFFLFSSPLFADDRIVVSATREEARGVDLPFSVHSVSGDRWEASGGEVENALSSVPGLSFTVSGGPGQTRSLLLRGSKAEHTLVLIDGIPVNDPLSPSRAFDFGQIPLHDIERIEVIKGPQSVLYGSDAMGGVVHIFTKRNTNTRLRFEGGSYETFKARAAALGFQAAYGTSRGFSAADERDGNTEPDGSESWSLGGKKDFPLGDSALLRVQAQYKDSRVDTDRAGGRGGDSRDTSARSSLFLFRGETVVFLPADLEWTFAGSHAGHDRKDNTNLASGDHYESGLIKLENILRRKFAAHALTLGTELGEEAGKSSQTSGGRRRFRSFGLYLQDQATFGRFQATAGARLDAHSEHERAQTYRLGLGYWLSPGFARAKGSVGTGFKAPSLYQTYSIYGSPQLKPERSVGGDLGLELTGDHWQAELTAFLNRFRDQIDFNTATSRYFNQSRAETYGLELLTEKTFGLFRLANSATLLRAYDRDTRLHLLRRPLFTDTLTIGVRKGDFVGANLHLRYVGRRVDTHPTTFTRQPMPAFHTLALDFFHHIGDGLRAVARGENLLDRRYQETSGFGVPGLSAYAGLEADL